MNEKTVELVDCTLRDGSYANNFQFTARDTRIICKRLEHAGIKYIEVGHGMGLGASTPNYGVAFESDIDYIRSARSAVQKAKVGVFFIPGIGASEQIKLASGEGIDFIRVGVNATESDEALQSVELALSKGLEVHLNLMKSYAIPAEELMRDLDVYTGIGLKSIYVVDSAGCMLPNKITEYVQVLKQGDWLVGFHGHNNLELANANCLAAVGAGATYVDSTLAGMGRSAGNAQTEVVAWLLKESGFDVGVDSFELFDLIESYVRPLMVYSQGRDALELTIGMSKFHSGFLSRFKRVLGKYDVDLYKLIWKVSQIDCVEPSIELIESVALDMSRTDE